MRVSLLEFLDVSCSLPSRSWTYSATARQTTDCTGCGFRARCFRSVSRRGSIRQVSKDTLFKLARRATTVHLVQYLEKRERARSRNDIQKNVYFSKNVTKTEQFTILVRGQFSHFLDRISIPRYQQEYIKYKISRRKFRPGLAYKITECIGISSRINTGIIRTSLILYPS